MIREIKYIDKAVKVEVADTTEHIQKHWMCGTFYEAQKNGLLNRIAQQKKGVYLDIGACIGNHSLFFSQVLGCEVHSFEPVKESFDHLTRNIYLNNADVNTYNVALGEKKGTCSMQYQDKKNIGMYQVGKGKDTLVVALDSFSFDFDVMKVDIEHYNEPFLKGAKRTLTEGTGVVYIECEDREILEMTDRYMTEYGYTITEGLVMNHTPTYEWTKL